MIDSKSRYPYSSEIDISQVPQLGELYKKNKKDTIRDALLPHTVTRYFFFNNTRYAI